MLKKKFFKTKDEVEVTFARSVFELSSLWESSNGRQKKNDKASAYAVSTTASANELG